MAMVIMMVVEFEDEAMEYGDLVSERKERKSKVRVIGNLNRGD